MLHPDHIESLPDHSDEVEKIATKDGVDTVIPKHMGNGEVGRFCVSFLVLTEDKILLFVLVGQENPDFKKVDEILVQNDYDVYGDLWNQYVVFKWEDRSSAYKANVKTDLYARQYTDKQGVREERIPELTEEQVQGENRNGLPDCDCHTHGVIEKRASPINVKVGICENCGRPYDMSLDGEASTLFRSSTDLEWIEGGWGPGVDPESASGLRFYQVRVDEDPKPADATLHALTREARLEFPDFHHYIGDQHNGLMVGDPNLGESGEIVGSLLWSRPKEIPVITLQQLSIRPKYRGQGYGKQLVDFWHRHIADSGSYYALDPNQGGMQLLKSVGHISDDRDCVATPMKAISADDTHKGDADPVEQSKLFNERKD